MSFINKRILRKSVVVAALILVTGSVVYFRFASDEEPAAESVDFVEEINEGVDQGTSDEANLDKTGVVETFVEFAQAESVEVWGSPSGEEIISDEEETDEHAHVLEHWRGKIDPPLREWRSLDLALGTGEVMEFALPNGTTLPMTFMRYESYGGDKGVYVGAVTGKPFAEVTLSYVRNSVAGAIRMPSDGVSWEIRNAGNGEQYFELVDLSTLGVCGVCNVEE